MYFRVEFRPVKGERPENACGKKPEVGMFTSCANPAGFGRCSFTNQIKSVLYVKKKKKRLRKKKTSSETVSQIFQAPSEDWKPRNFGNATLSSCSVVETSNFLLWKVGVAAVFCVCMCVFFGQEQGSFFLWKIAAI